MRAFLRLGAALALVLTSVGASTAANIPAHYFVLTLDANGKVASRFAAEVTLKSALRGSASDGAQQLRRDADSVAVALRDQTNRVVYRDVVAVPRVLRGEFQRASGQGIDGHFVAAGERAFVVKVPASSHGTLEVAAPGARTPVRFDVDTLLAESRSRSASAAAPPSLVPLPGWENGRAENRVELLVLGDGYTVEEEAEFDEDALAVVNGMFGVSPYHDYRNYVNALALFTPSLESGADQPPYDSGCSDYGFGQTCCSDPSSSGRAARFVDTAFDASYCTLDIQRLLTVNATKIFSAAADVADWDQILVIVNASEYGGSGGGLSVISVNASAIHIAQHEYGHTFAALADEYATAYPGYPACSDVISGAPACERNVTDQTERELVKWSKWIDATQPVPSSGPPPVASNAGLWLGARYLSSGMYRQGYACIMRYLGAPFCDVAAEAYVMRLYEGGWGTPSGGIDVIEPGTESPPPGHVDLAYPGGTFSAQVLGPVEGPSLDVRWILDGIDVSASDAATGETVSYELTTTPGVHSLQLRVTDVSAILHPTTRPTLARTRTWDIAIGSASTTTLLGSTTTSTTSTAPQPTTTVTATSSSTTTVAQSTTTTLDSSSTTLPSSTTTIGGGTTSTTVDSPTTTSTVPSHPICARPLTDGSGPVATDCLFILNAAVSNTTCTPECVCAPKGSLPVTATDALICLHAAVGGAVELACPCGPFP